MTDSGTVDIHISPYDYTNDIQVNLWLSCDVPFASRYFTKPGVHRYPPESSPCSLYRCSRYRFCSSFSLTCSGIPVIKSQGVWPDDSGYRNSERAREYISIVGGANPTLELFVHLSNFPVNLKDVVMITLLQMTFEQPQSPPYGKK